MLTSVLPGREREQAIGRALTPEEALDLALRND